MSFTYLTHIQVNINTKTTKYFTKQLQIWSKRALKLKNSLELNNRISIDVIIRNTAFITFSHRI